MPRSLDSAGGEVRSGLHRVDLFMSGLCVGDSLPLHVAISLDEIGR
jgi:hypothetical protein